MLARTRVMLAASLLCLGQVQAAEWTLTLPQGVPGEIRNNALFELFVPDALPANRPVRGIVAVFNYEAGREIYDDATFRAWAEVEGFALLRHQMRNLDNQFTVAKTQSAADMLLQTALPQLATLAGRPEIAHAGLIWTGLSQAGWAAFALAGFSESRTIGVMPIHDSTGERAPELGNSTDGLSLPTLHLLGEDDNVNMGSVAGGNLYAQTILGHAAQRRANGGRVAVAIQRDSNHTRWEGRTTFDLQFMQDWMSAVAARRVPTSFPVGQPYALNTVDEASGVLGQLSLALADASPFVQVTSAAVEAYAPGRADRWWLPDGRIAAAWADYNATGSYVLAPPVVEAVSVPVPVAACLLAGVLVGAIGATAQERRSGRALTAAR